MPTCPECLKEYKLGEGRLYCTEDGEKLVGLFCKKCNATEIFPSEKCCRWCGISIPEFWLSFPPFIKSFDARPSSIVVGTPVTLGWVVKRATKVEINPTVVIPPSPHPDIGAVTITPNESTTYILIASNQIGQKVSKEVSIWVTKEALSIPQLISPENNSTAEPSFKWTSIEGTTSYEIWVAYDPTFMAITRGFTLGVTDCFISGLAVGITHYWRVRAKSNDFAVNDSDWSDVWKFTVA